MKLHLVPFMLLITLALMLAACSIKVAQDSPGSESVEFFTYEIRGDQGHPEASFAGTLLADCDGGFVCGEFDGGGRVGMVFPEGTVLTESGSELLLPTGESIPLGVDVELGGVYLEPPEASLSVESDWEPLDEYFYVFTV